MVMRPGTKRGFVTLDVLWIIVLVCLAGYLSVRGIGLVDRRDKFERLNRELAEIAEAVDDVALVEGLEPGELVPFEQYSSYLEERVAKRLRIEGRDPFGGRYGDQVVGAEAVPDAATIEALGDLWN